MFKTTNRSTKDTEYITVSTDRLAEILDCGKATARTIGEKAEAKIKIGRRTLWNIGKIRQYLNDN